MRDLKTDLDICEKTTPSIEALEEDDDLLIVTVTEQNRIKEYVAQFAGLNRDNDVRFYVEAREGWPEAIRRAIKAEAQAAAMREALEHIAIGQCVFKQMAKFQMGFGFSEQAFTEQYGFCDCATCVTSKALAALDGIPIPPEGSDV